LSEAVDSFRQKFGGFHLPSRLKLSETCNYLQRGQPGTLDADSVEYLQALWPQLDLAPETRIDWNGDGRIQGDWVLEGDECLVYFLGGIPTSQGGAAGCLGFSKDPHNPVAQDFDPRVGPFFAFPSDRLRDIHGRGFLSFLDYYGHPYAYFSSYPVAGYNRYGGTDCPTLGVWPYAREWDPVPRFWNPDSFQIISAGSDGKFGPGTTEASRVWSPATAAAMPVEGRDDLTNFHNKALGVP
jgi:hypothetical protein